MEEIARRNRAVAPEVLDALGVAADEVDVVDVPLAFCCAREITLTPVESLHWSPESTTALLLKVISAHWCMNF